MCRFICSRHLADFPEGWCDECRAENTRAMDEAFRQHVTEQEADAVLSIPAATDAEWAARLAEIAPNKVGDQASDRNKIQLRTVSSWEQLGRRRSKPYIDSTDYDFTSPERDSTDAETF